MPHNAATYIAIARSTQNYTGNRSSIPVGGRPKMLYLTVLKESSAPPNTPRDMFSMPGYTKAKV